LQKSIPQILSSIVLVWDVPWDFIAQESSKPTIVTNNKIENTMVKIIFNINKKYQILLKDHIKLWTSEIMFFFNYLFLNK
jgi:hypothetical protein